MFLLLWTEAGLELVEVGGVGQVEVGPRHEHRGLHLTLRHVLQRKHQNDIDYVAL